LIAADLSSCCRAPWCTCQWAWWWI